MCHKRFTEYPCGHRKIRKVVCEKQKRAAEERDCWSQFSVWFTGPVTCNWGSDEFKRVEIVCRSCLDVNENIGQGLQKLFPTEGNARPGGFVQSYTVDQQPKARRPMVMRAPPPGGCNDRPRLHQTKDRPVIQQPKARRPRQENAMDNFLNAKDSYSKFEAHDVAYVDRQPTLRQPKARRPKQEEAMDGLLNAKDSYSKFDFNFGASVPAPPPNVFKTAREQTWQAPGQRSSRLDRNPGPPPGVPLPPDPPRRQRAASTGASGSTSLSRSNATKERSRNKPPSRSASQERPREPAKSNSRYPPSSHRKPPAAESSVPGYRYESPPGLPEIRPSQRTKTPHPRKPTRPSPPSKPAAARIRDPEPSRRGAQDGRAVAHDPRRTVSARETRTNPRVKQAAALAKMQSQSLRREARKVVEATAAKGETKPKTQGLPMYAQQAGKKADGPAEERAATPLIDKLFREVNDMWNPLASPSESSFACADSRRVERKD